MLAKEYPFNLNEPSPNIDEEIKTNVGKLASVSEDCKQCIFALMRANSNNRMPFDFIETHPWFKANSTVSVPWERDERERLLQGLSTKIPLSLQANSKKDKGKLPKGQAAASGKSSNQQAAASPSGKGLPPKSSSGAPAKGEGGPSAEDKAKAQKQIAQLARDINSSISELSIRSASFLGNGETAPSEDDHREMARVIETLRQKVVYLINSLKTLLPNLATSKKDELLEDVSLLEVCSDAITVEQFEKYSSMMLQIMAKIDKLLDEVKPSWA